MGGGGGGGGGEGSVSGRLECPLFRIPHALWSN